MTDKLELDIPVVLPEVPDSTDACVSRLVSTLSTKLGVDRVHVLAAENSSPAKLCIHYDPAIVPLARIRELAQVAGAEISARFGHALWQVEGISHQRRANTVSERVRAIAGVVEASASSTGQVHVEFDREKTSEQHILEVMATLGVAPARRPSSATTEHGSAGHQHASDEKGAEHTHAHGGLLGANTEMIFALTCGVLMGAGVAIEKLIGDAPSWLPLACYILAYFFGGFFTLREAVDNLRLKRFEIDTLMLVAAAGAAALGSWAEGALLLFLFSLGHALEHYAMGRAKRAIEALAELAPDTAIVRRNGQTEEIKVEDLVVGDTVLVRPNERLPADGFVLKGNSSVNQAPVTGESIPVDKRAVADAGLARSKPDTVDAASRVFAGTINGGGAIEIEVTRKSTDSALARVVKMVSEAETRKSPTQRFTDKFERIFVPAVLLLAFALLFAWVVIDEPFRDSFYRAMAVLVAASPCALAIATPSAVLSGIARAARGGVLIKGGAPLEELGSLNAMAFDKTGTLTEGRPRITDVLSAEDISEEELLTVAVAVESLSDHPLAAAIARDGRERLGGRAIPTASSLENLIGRGVAAELDGDKVLIGKAEMFGTQDVPPLSTSTQAAIRQLRDAGRTSMAVRRGNRDLGAIGLLDTPREGARETLERLRELGITRMIMISGDHANVAQAVAKDVGLDEAWGDLMPEDKVEAIRKLRQQTKVAMVGDGVNDAPAMANATVGIAMGAAGSDVALETADIALMSDNLRQLPFAVGLSRHTKSIIRQNVFVSLGIVAILVPSTILGLGIGPAVAVHEGSTLLVVINALRLLAYRNT
ncbi:heavy metal translocating P-type ATPase [Pigmentiphaga sp. GD03639]|uniref:heavy metal translocating P-type ATPase n=1 Tax=unclassified Pigmentiphaga TaxID=2626614 RepID=UPI000B40E030|nr:MULTISPECIES: heavy metal translocating P-type ATPase [unclassified Pigmentiphaga]MDH2240152.1 heavy metal translocating P-type ATPase [Pigmentiphaga sp. GD03639]OVZ65345.1 heavy metal translocating P-type ATPase [Pigmentiphaga sp. NML030171]